MFDGIPRPVDRDRRCRQGAKLISVTYVMELRLGEAQNHRIGKPHFSNDGGVGMSRLEDRAYYEARLETERQLAASSDDPAIAHLHALATAANKAA